MPHPDRFDRRVRLERFARAPQDTQQRGAPVLERRGRLRPRPARAELERRPLRRSPRRAACRARAARSCGSVDAFSAFRRSRSRRGAAASPRCRSARAPRDGDSAACRGRARRSRTRRSGTRRSARCRSARSSRVVVGAAPVRARGGTLPSAARAVSTAARACPGTSSACAAHCAASASSLSSRRALSQRHIGETQVHRAQRRAARAERMNAPDGETERDARTGSRADRAEERAHLPRRSCIGRSTITTHAVAARIVTCDVPRPRCAPNAPSVVKTSTASAANAAPAPDADAVSPPQSVERNAKPIIEAKRVRLEPAASARQVQKAPIAAHAKIRLVQQIAEQRASPSMRTPRATLPTGSLRQTPATSSTPDGAARAHRETRTRSARGGPSRSPTRCGSRPDSA